MDKKKRMAELNEILSKAADSYYNTGVEIMSDHEYDELYDELERLENTYIRPSDKLFLSKLDISCINFTDCSCDIDGYGSKKCYHHYNNTKKFCFYQKNDIERYYCNCKEYVQLNCPSGTFNEDSDKNYRCM